jgi:hypothetical protein
VITEAACCLKALNLAKFNNGPTGGVASEDAEVYQARAPRHYSDVRMNPSVSGHSPSSVGALRDVPK